MLAKEIRDYIQKPVLERAGWIDDASKILIYGTGYVETGYNALMQYGTPRDSGVGFYQCQPSDYEDISAWISNGLNKPLRNRILGVCNFMIWPREVEMVAWDIAFATLVCRIHYHRIKDPLPDAKDSKGMAEYHEKFYNGGPLGKADVDKNTIMFQRIINDEI